MAAHGLFKFLSKSESQQVTNRSRSAQPRNPKLEPFHVGHPLSSPPDPIPSPYRSTILVSAIQLPDHRVLLGCVSPIWAGIANQEAVSGLANIVCVFK